jgi:hypothetical protein
VPPIDPSPSVTETVLALLGIGDSTWKPGPKQGGDGDPDESRLGAAELLPPSRSGQTVDLGALLRGLAGGGEQ